MYRSRAGGAGIVLQFRIQSTPNPLARKYILSQELKAGGRVSYQNPSECSHVPLALALIGLDGITQVHFFENVLTVTQDGARDWAELDQGVQALVRAKISNHDTHFEDYACPEKKPREGLSPELLTIDEILDRTIRPGLQMDGGDVELLDIEGSILSIRYLGACGGCPSSLAGTLQAITQILREEFRSDLEVVAV